MPEDILLFSEETFPNGKEQPDLPTQDATYGLLTCVINVSVQAGVTVGLHLWHVHKIKMQNMNPFNTRKSSDFFFYDLMTFLLKWTGFIFTSQDFYKLHISFFPPLPAETGILKTSEAD